MNYDIEISLKLSSKDHETLEKWQSFKSVLTLQTSEDSKMVLSSYKVQQTPKYITEDGCYQEYWDHQYLQTTMDLYHQVLAAIETMRFIKGPSVNRENCIQMNALRCAEKYLTDMANKLTGFKNILHADLPLPADGDITWVQRITYSIEKDRWEYWAIDYDGFSSQKRTAV